MTQRPHPVILCILDGWGHRLEAADNAIAQAHLPTWSRLIEQSPFALLEASAQEVGLPEGQMGNSEVGHMNIGAGRIVLQDLPRIDRSIALQEFQHYPAFQDFVQKLKQSRGSCHLMGLLSSGGVHAHQNHILAFAKALAAHAIPVKIHAFLDGRDTSPRSGKDFVAFFLKEISDYPLIQLVSLSGRYYAMDRDQRWDRTEKAYRALVEGQAPSFQDPLAYIEENYHQNITDEFILPAIAEGHTGIAEGDGLFHCNFRSDRVRQLLSSLVLPDFTSFDRHGCEPFESVLGMAQYADHLNPYCPALFPPQKIEKSLGEIISKQGLKQLRAAETEKYAHVTFFFNGGQEQVFEGEDRLLVPSPRVATYDLKPEMSAHELTEKLIQAQHDHAYDLIVVNYANADMVGHSGNLEASIKAVETLDACLSQLCELVDKTQGVLLVTADHGNVEQIYDPETKQPHTAHTLNPVPLVIYGLQKSKISLQDGQLCDVASTILDIMGLTQPAEMTGRTLISKN